MMILEYKRYRYQRQSGFTLLEMIVVIIIMGILAAFAIPSYQRYATKARMEEAKSVLNQDYLWLDKIYNKNNGYKLITSGSSSGSPITKADLPYKKTNGGYRFDIRENCSSNATAQTTDATFCLLAIPDGRQSLAEGGGKECGILMVDQAGQYQIQPTGSSSPISNTANGGVNCF